ncbi:hypothetical protein C8P63_101244 [Melghirimyces profundicolus]|uniref:Uncharacterized protein n=1 Tax=Melghirimyces profundicolus TaxID=1242148 RepID=A0A2T6C9P3_9BACL|nr:hypothetical protein C8P63_101244 [Melghirimyces profundicolus]
MNAVMADRRGRDLLQKSDCRICFAPHSLCGQGKRRYCIEWLTMG